MAALGVAFLAAGLSGRAGLFVRSWFVPAVLGAGALLLLVALRGRVALPGPAAAILLLPVVVGLAVTPGLAGRITTEVGAARAVGARWGDGANPLLAGGGGDVTLLDVMLAERGVGAVALDGRQITVEGAVRRGEIRRLAMVCCAADARPLALRLTGDLPADGTWVRATGRLRARGAGLVLETDRVAAIDPPSDPFL